MSGSLFDKTPGTAAGLLVPGNINLHTRPRVQNRDGSFSTVRSITTTDDDGRAILIPTVIGDRVVPPDVAINYFMKTGQHLGIFKDISTADAYAQSLHDAQASEYGPAQSDAEIGALTRSQIMPPDVRRGALEGLQR